MARFNSQDVDKYGNGGGAGYFSLKNDKDTAKVRFLYSGIDDVVGYSVHQVQVGDSTRYVNCLRNYNDPIDACPLCKDHQFTSAKMFIPVYNIDEDKVQIWERGKRFFSQISSLCARYAGRNPLCAQVFEIERNGAKGDTNTTYGIYPIGSPDETQLEDLPEVPEIVGTRILDKSFEELENYVNTGSFDTEEQPQIRRRSAESQRRTPATGRSAF